MTQSLATIIQERSVAIPFSGCWIWMGPLSSGYGALSHKGKWMRAHRASFIASNPGKPPPKLVCHDCDVKECVNPAHLYSGDHTTNRADVVTRSGWTNSFGRRDQCGVGHQYEEGSYFLNKAGARICVECKNAKQRAYRAAKKEAQK